MPNSYFQFKQFKIEQNNCANKVSTDACVFGAVVAQMLNNTHKILDVGCGSGLLSLMLAQKGANVIGIEIENKCYQQAKENIKESRFSSQIEIINDDIRTYKTEENFDFIISNPPFFNNTYKNPNETKNIARQAETLCAEDWIKIIENNTQQNTILALLLSNNDVFEAYKSVFSKMKYSNQKIIMLYDKRNAKCKRVILLASRNDKLPNFSNSITYKNNDNSYTQEFTNLLKSYYLYL
ncbi:MAG: methyltransferase [Bacteroidetes bacterium]|nr:methyltransferase [Bacteroidota bacterium]MCB9227433.1 methyltransferase [Chitinophagales bacterium]